jgi:hypothetical protein
VRVVTPRLRSVTPCWTYFFLPPAWSGFSDFCSGFASGFASGLSLPSFAPAFFGSGLQLPFGQFTSQLAFAAHWVWQFPPLQSTLQVDFAALFV